MSEHKSKFKIVIVLVAVGFMFGAFLLSSKSDSPKLDHPNIILISIDTLRADHLSCYGYKRPTPSIDSLAEDGALFANAVAQSSWTLPSHISLFTGLYPSGHGVISDDRKLDKDHVTLAEVLQDTGYETTAFTDGGYLNEKWGYQGFDRFDDKGEKGIEAIYTKAVSWLRQNHSKPFFLFLHTYQPHSPYDPPPAYDKYSDNDYDGIVDVSLSAEEDYYESIQSKMTLEDYRYVIDKYDGDIYYTDYFLGKLFQELKDLGLYDKSVIVFTSDHGENFLDHPDSVLGHVGHYELYDEIVKVPLIIKAPTFPENQVINDQVESIDIMPTLLELVGIPTSHRIDGVSLVELVEKGIYDGTFAFSERRMGPDRKHKDYKMVRSNDWKLLLRANDEPRLLELELYNLRVDPEEQHDLHAEKAKVGKSLFEELEAWMDTQEGKSKSADEMKLDDELKEQLRGLGYIN